MGIEYLHTRNAIHAELTSVEQTFSPALTTALWKLNTKHSALETINQSLEAQVAERTHDLEQANRQLVRTDPLTGAANRRHFVEQVQIDIHRARRDNTPLSLLMIDPDHFGWRG